MIKASLWSSNGRHHTGGVCWLSKGLGSAALIDIMPYKSAPPIQAPRRHLCGPPYTAPDPAYITAHRTTLPRPLKASVQTDQEKVTQAASLTAPPTVMAMLTGVTGGGRGRRGGRGRGGTSRSRSGARTLRCVDLSFVGLSPNRADVHAYIPGSLCCDAYGTS